MALCLACAYGISLNLFHIVAAYCISLSKGHASNVLSSDKPNMRRAAAQAARALPAAEATQAAAEAAQTARASSAAEAGSVFDWAFKIT